MDQKNHLTELALQSPPAGVKYDLGFGVDLVRTLMKFFMGKLICLLLVMLLLLQLACTETSPSSFESLMADSNGLQ